MIHTILQIDPFFASNMAQWGAVGVLIFALLIAVGFLARFIVTQSSKHNEQLDVLNKRHNDRFDKTINDSQNQNKLMFNALSDIGGGLSKIGEGISALSRNMENDVEANKMVHEQLKQISKELSKIERVFSELKSQF